MLVELSVVEQRYHAVMEVVSGGIPVVKVAETLWVSRKAVHAWLRRYRQDGLPGLARPIAPSASPPRAVCCRDRSSVGELRRPRPRSVRGDCP